MKRTPLKRTSPLKRSSSLSSTSSLKRTPLKNTSSLKRKRTTARVSDKPYKSVFTSDLSICYFTGLPSSSYDPVDVHHIFGGAYKASSEKYGYIIPLRRSLHTLTQYSVHEYAPFNDFLKKTAEAHWLSEGRSKEDFIATFGRWY